MYIRPEYWALQNKYDVVCKEIEHSKIIASIAHKLFAKRIIGRSVCFMAVNALGAGREAPLVIAQMMQPVNLRIYHTPKSFYDLCDVFDENDLSKPISDILRKECGE